MHNHVNLVHTLASKIDTHFPTVAAQLRSFGGYKTGIFGKWYAYTARASLAAVAHTARRHLGDEVQNRPSGFDEFEILRNHGSYFDPEFISAQGSHYESGYTTDLITDKTIEFMSRSKAEGKPFFVMSHHKAPHAPWDPHPRYQELYAEPIKVPDTFDDDYKNRAAAAAAANMRIKVCPASWCVGGSGRS